MTLFVNLTKFEQVQEGTVWKFQDLSVTQILREINFWDSKNARLAILTHLEALNLNLYEICTF